MVAPDALADTILADLKAVLAGWVCRRRLSRAAVKALMAQVSRNIELWVRELQEPRRKEGPNHGHTHSPRQFA